MTRRIAALPEAAVEVGIEELTPEQAHEERRRLCAEYRAEIEAALGRTDIRLANLFAWCEKGRRGTW